MEEAYVLAFNCRWFFDWMDSGWDKIIAVWFDWDNYVLRGISYDREKNSDCDDYSGGWKLSCRFLGLETKFNLKAYKCGSCILLFFYIDGNEKCNFSSYWHGFDAVELENS